MGKLKNTLKFFAIFSSVMLSVSIHGCLCIECEDKEITPSYTPQPIMYNYDFLKYGPPMSMIIVGPSAIPDYKLNIGLYNYGSKIMASISYGNKAYTGFQIYTPPYGYEVLKITSPDFESLDQDLLSLGDRSPGQSISVGSGLVESYIFKMSLAQYGLRSESKFFLGPFN